MRSSSPTPPPGRASLLVLGMAAFMVQADARVIDPLLHVIARDFHTIPPSAAIVISAYALPYGLFQLFYGPLGDRIGKLRAGVEQMLTVIQQKQCSFAFQILCEGKSNWPAYFFFQTE